MMEEGTMGRSHRSTMRFLAATVLLGGAWGSMALAQPSVITVRIQQEMTYVDPHYAQGHTENTIVRHLAEGLVTLNEQLEVIPMLAESWDVSEDGLVYTFHLRQGVLFHNGASMTAEDVKFSLDRFRAVSPRSGDLELVESVEVVDDFTVRVHLSAPDVTFLAMLANPYTIAIMPVGSASVEPGEPSMAPIATGPFRFASWEQGNSLVFHRFDAYAPIDLPASGLGGHKEALVDELVFRVIPDGQATIAGLQTGELDFATDIPPQDVDRLEGPNQPFSMVQIPGTYASLLYFNVSSPLTDDTTFRQAVVHAIDKELVLEATYWGRGATTSTLIHDTTAWHTDVHGTDPFPYDPERARQLLQEAGYAGEALVINSSTGPQRDVALVVDELLRAVGINSSIVHVERATYTDYLYSGGFQILSANTPLRFDPDQRYSMWHAERSSLAFDYSNPLFDEAVDAARQTADFEERKALYTEAERILQQDAVVVPLYFQNVIYAVGNRLVGFDPNPHNWYQFWNVSLRD